MKLCSVTTLKASVYETLSFVSYHLNAGIDHMYLFFDDPNDAAIDPVEDRVDRVSCIRCTEDHWDRLGLQTGAAVQQKQEVNATYALRLARRAGAEWIVHLDHDELLYSEKSIETVFSGVSSSTDVILFPVMEAVPQRLYYERPLEEIRLSKLYVPVGVDHQTFSVRVVDRLRHLVRSQIWYRKKQFASSLGCRHADMFGQYILGHTAGKSATRTSARVDRVQNHTPVPAGDARLGLHVSRGGAVLHFDCRGYDSWKSKWIGRVTGSANFETDRLAPHRARQLQLFRRAYEREDGEALRSLYRDWYIMSEREQSILRRLGLLLPVRLSPSHFRYAGLQT